MYGTVTRSEDLDKLDKEAKRLQEQITLTIKRGTLEAIFRAFRRDPYRDVVFHRPVSRKKQRQIRKDAQDDLAQAATAGEHN